MATTIEINHDLIKAVGDIPITLRNGPLGKCLGAYGKPIANTASTLARSSRESGSRRKWSKKLRNNAAYQNDSKDHFGVKVLRNGLGVYVGATYPKGNKQQFVMPIKRGDSYQQYRWGKPGQAITTTSRKGTQYTYVRGSPVKSRFTGPRRGNPGMANYPREARATVRGFDQAKGQAESAFLGELNKQIKELRIG